LRTQHSEARQAMKDVLRKMLTELGTLDQGIGEFSQQVQGYAESVQSAGSLDGLAAVVQQVVTASHAVQTLVSSTRERVQTEHERARELQERVRGLEDELRRLSDEAVTDTLTRVANRRGLNKQFDIECARALRAGVEIAPLAIGLIDLDNFKKLNDSLGHAAGDAALQALATRVSQSLRPTDHVARYGGEEFVVLLPGTGLPQAVDALTRLQRKLSAALFIHEEREVFVTFSAGVTLWREGESIDTVLARADEGMYEAKRSGKNRTCTA
jgi:diguanylate cyclase